MPLVVLDARRRGFGEIIVAVVVMVDAEDTLDSADDTPDRAANDRTDRPGAAVAFLETMRGAAGNALRLRRTRGENCKNGSDEGKANFHEVLLCCSNGSGRVPANRGHTATQPCGREVPA